MFICFEGIDGTGKSTQAEMLAWALRGMDYKVVQSKEPGGTDLGFEIRSLLWYKIKTQHMAPYVADCLLLADHIQHVEKTIKPMLADGLIVITDRYAYSQFAYSAGRETHPLIQQAYKELFGPVPDVTFLLLGDVQKLLARANARPDKKQDGKAWNDTQKMADIQRQYLAMDAPELHKIWCDELTAEQLHAQFILPKVESMLHDPKRLSTTDIVKLASPTELH